MASSNSPGAFWAARLPGFLPRYVRGSAAELLAQADLPPRPADCVRLVMISDTHEAEEQVTVPPCDVLLHCGDVTEDCVRAPFG